MLGPEGRGLFALVLLLPEWGKNFGLLGFEQANAVYAGLEPEKRRTLVWQSVIIAGVVGGIFAVGGISFVAAGAPGFPALAQAPVWLCVLPLIAVPSGLIITYWFEILRGMNRIVVVNLAEVWTKVTSILLVLILVVWLQLGVAGAVWADVLATLGSMILAIVLLRWVRAWGMPVFDRALLKRTAGFAIPAYAGTAAAFVNYRFGELIVALLLLPKELGFYVMAVGLAERLWILTGAVATALLPHLTNSADRDPALPAAIARHVMVWTGAACLGVYLAADLLIKILFSSEFAAVAAPLRWLLPGVFVLSVGKVLVAELLAREKPLYATGATVVATVVNIAGNLALIPRLGLSGAAIASSISYSVLSILVTWCYLRETGVAWTRLVPCRGDLLAYTGLWRRLRTSPR
jgi:O-antigen/teichoic acid export membrane protein